MREAERLNHEASVALNKGRSHGQHAAKGMQGGGARLAYPAGAPVPNGTNYQHHYRQQQGHQQQYGGYSGYAQASHGQLGPRDNKRHRTEWSDNSRGMNQQQYGGYGQNGHVQGHGYGNMGYPNGYNNMQQGGGCPHANNNWGGHASNAPMQQMYGHGQGQHNAGPAFPHRPPTLPGPPRGQKRGPSSTSEALNEESAQGGNKRLAPLRDVAPQPQPFAPQAHDTSSIAQLPVSSRGRKRRAGPG